ncbi:MAG: hypothetical protein AB202_02910 [Parcubacteria bacterium C7867-007]|nr:MAG: hypothetical protein AB202_02910 [Parcubacteria bacterium C7867-007]
MTTAILGIKELQNNLKRIADAALKGQSFTVVRDSKPVFRIEPILPTKRTGTLEDALATAKFKGDKDLSNRIDEIVYGNTR